MNHYRSKVAVLVAMLGITLASAPASMAEQAGADNPAAAAAFLDDAQKQQIRSQLALALASLDESEARATAAGEPMVATFVDLTRRYLEMIRLAILGEDRHGNSATVPDRAEMIALIDRTRDHIELFRDRYAQYPEMEAYLPKLDAMESQLSESRRQLAWELATASSRSPLTASADDVFANAQAQLDVAFRRIQGSPDEADLRARLEELQARLDRARETGGVVEWAAPLE